MLIKLKEIWGLKRTKKKWVISFPFIHQCSYVFKLSWEFVFEIEYFRIFYICFCNFHHLPKSIHLSLSEETFWLDHEDFVFHPPRLHWYFLVSCAVSLAQLPPYWKAPALSLTMGLTCWQWAQMSAQGIVFVMLQFFISCFRTAWMFLFAYTLVIMSPRELNVAFLYLFW